MFIHLCMQLFTHPLAHLGAHTHFRFPVNVPSFLVYDFLDSASTYMYVYRDFSQVFFCTWLIFLELGRCPRQVVALLSNRLAQVWFMWLWHLGWFAFFGSHPLQSGNKSQVPRIGWWGCWKRVANRMRLLGWRVAFFRSFSCSKQLWKWSFLAAAVVILLCGQLLPLVKTPRWRTPFSRGRPGNRVGTWTLEQAPHDRIASDICCLFKFAFEMQLDKNVGKPLEGGLKF